MPEGDKPSFFRRAAGLFWKFPEDNKPDKPVVSHTLEEDVRNGRYGNGPYRTPEFPRGREEEVGFLTLNESESRRLQLEKLELPAYPQADALIQEIIDKNIDINKPAGRQQFVEQWQKQCPDLPTPCVPDANDNWSNGNYWYLTQLFAGKIVSSLTDPDKKAKPNFSQRAILYIDSWQEEDWNDVIPGSIDKKLRTIISPLLQEFLGQSQTGVVKIKRQDIDSALWQGDLADRIPTEKHKQILQKLNLNPNQYEFRLIRQDEYARAARSKNWGQKALWTNFDNYYLGDGGGRCGLLGGDREAGGSSDVGDYWRGYVAEDLAVRLVLSRKQK